RQLRRQPRPNRRPCAVRKSGGPGGDHLLFHRRGRLDMEDLGVALDGALEPDFFHHQVAPMASRRPKLSLLEDAIGYRFSKRGLLEQALTHVSVVASKGGRTKSYQRLEFLGDRVLGLGVAEMLIAAFPKAEEGELSRRFAALVRKDACADVAVKWGV